MPKYLLGIVALCLVLFIPLIGGCKSEPSSDTLKEFIEDLQTYSEEEIIPYLETRQITVWLEDDQSPMSLGYIYSRPEGASVHGKTEFEIKNIGNLPHDFNIPKLNIHSGKIAPGETKIITISTPKKAGDYEIFSSGIKIGAFVIRGN